MLTYRVMDIECSQCPSHGEGYCLGGGTISNVFGTGLRMDTARRDGSSGHFHLLLLVRIDSLGTRNFTITDGAVAVEMC